MRSDQNRDDATNKEMVPWVDTIGGRVYTDTDLDEMATAIEAYHIGLRQKLDDAHREIQRLKADLRDCGALEIRRLHEEWLASLREAANHLYVDLTDRGILPPDEGKALAHQLQRIFREDNGILALRIFLDITVDCHRFHRLPLVDDQLDQLDAFVRAKHRQMMQLIPSYFR
jgi:hypothetical protein